MRPDGRAKNNHESGESAAATTQPDLVTRLRWHAMDRSNHYTSLTAEAAKVIEEQDREIARLQAVVEEAHRARP